MQMAQNSLAFNLGKGLGSEEIFSNTLRTHILHFGPMSLHPYNEHKDFLLRSVLQNGSEKRFLYF